MNKLKLVTTLSSSKNMQVMKHHLKLFVLLFQKKKNQVSCLGSFIDKVSSKPLILKTIQLTK
jgi:hypothetical protein